MLNGLPSMLVLVVLAALFRLTGHWVVIPRDRGDDDGRGRLRPEQPWTGPPGGGGGRTYGRLAEQHEHELARSA